MENKIDSLAKSSFTSPAQKTSKCHILLREEKHEKGENWIENKYRTTLSWRLERKKRIYLKGKPGRKEISPPFPKSIRHSGKKKKSKQQPRNPEPLLLSGEVNPRQRQGRAAACAGVWWGLAMGQPMWSILQQLEMLWAWTKMPLSGLVRVYAFIRVICGMCPGAKSPVTSSSLCFQPWSGYGQNGDEGVKISLILAAAKSMVLGCVGGSNAIIISQSICRVNQSPYLVSGRYLFWGQAGRDHWVVFAFIRSAGCAALSHQHSLHIT